MIILILTLVLFCCFYCSNGGHDNNDCDETESNTPGKLCAYPCDHYSFDETSKRNVPTKECDACEHKNYCKGFSEGIFYEKNGLLTGDELRKHLCQRFSCNEYSGLNQCDACEHKNYCDGYVEGYYELVDPAEEVAPGKLCAYPCDHYSFDETGKRNVPSKECNACEHKIICKGFSDGILCDEIKIIPVWELCAYLRHRNSCDENGGLAQCDDECKIKDYCHGFMDGFYIAKEGEVDTMSAICVPGSQFESDLASGKMIPGVFCTDCDSLVFCTTYMSEKKLIDAGTESQLPCEVNNSEKNARACGKAKNSWHFIQDCCHHCPVKEKCDGLKFAHWTKK